MKVWLDYYRRDYKTKKQKASPIFTTGHVYKLLHNVLRSALGTIMILEIKLVIPTSQKQPLGAAAALVKKKYPRPKRKAYMSTATTHSIHKVFDYYWYICLIPAVMAWWHAIDVNKLIYLQDMIIEVKTSFCHVKLNITMILSNRFYCRYLTKATPTREILTARLCRLITF